MPAINERERAFGSLLLNQMAFEYAREHCGLPLPKVRLETLQSLIEIGVPLVFDLERREYEAEPRRLRRMSIAEQCFTHFENIRHNLIHGNKAGILDDQVRLQNLLDWADRFAAEVLGGENDFSRSAYYAKAALGVENL